MKRVLSLFLLLFASLSLSSCALLTAPFKLLESLFTLGSRTVGLAESEPVKKPLQFEQREWKSARETLQGQPLPLATPPDTAVAAAAVAQVR